MLYYVYILQSLKDHKYYIGSTKDVQARLRYHNAGLQRSTYHRIPFIVVKFEEYASEELALKREKQIKSWKGGRMFKQLISGKLVLSSRHDLINEVIVCNYLVLFVIMLRRSIISCTDSYLNCLAFS